MEEFIEGGLESIRNFLDRQNREIKEMTVAMSLAYWNATISGKEEDYKDYEKKTLKIKKYFSNKESFEKVRDFLKKSNNHLEKRQLEILYREYLSCQGDFKLIEEITKKSSEIEYKFNTFRANVDGQNLTDNEIKEILKKNTNSENLKRAWEASKEQGRLVEKELVELIKLRNKLAKSLGFDNYYVMSLELSEQKEGEIERIFIDLEESTKKSFKIVKDGIDKFLSEKYKINKEELKPWHYQDLFFQEAPEIYDINLDKFYNKDVLKIAEKFYNNLGFDIKDIVERSDWYEKPGKYQHAYCINADRKGDIRVIENIKNNEKWMDTTLHELGHAIYEKHCDESLPFLLRENVHTFVTEAIALLFGRNSKNILFIRGYCDIKDEETERIKEKIKKQLRLDELVFLKWSQVMFYFERELYKNPEQDLNKLWWDLVKKYQMINFQRDSSDWASKIHFVSAPVYYHNYLLGKILASQLNHKIVKEIVKGKDFLNPNHSISEMGDFLKKELFFHGKKWRWDKLIKKALKEELNPKYFIEDFCG